MHVYANERLHSCQTFTQLSNLARQKQTTPRKNDLSVYWDDEIAFNIVWQELKDKSDNTIATGENDVTVKSH